MNLDSVAEYLELQLIGTRGVDIFINSMPAENTPGLLLRQPFSGSKVDYELVGYRKTSFMLVSRARTHQAATTLLDAACLKLKLVNSTALAGMKINYMRQRHEAIPFPVTPGNMSELLVNIDANYVLV